jgi:hypothetical protein
MTATLRPLAAFVLLAWSPAFAQTICHDPPAGMSCPGDRLVWCNIPSHVYHFQGRTLLRLHEDRQVPMRAGCDP